ncbi:MAG: TolB family protein, partial [Flavobacteriales bacterium]
MKKHLLKALAFTLICLSANVNAQNEVWYFGGWPSKGLGLEFSGNTLIQRNNESTPFYYEASSVVSDGSGNVLFYSNGNNIYDKTHNLMTNGGGIIGSDEPAGAQGSAPQGVVTVNMPGNPNIYYVFTTGDAFQLTNWGGTNNGLHYNIVDLSVGANGTVTSKNQVLLNGVTTPTTESMFAIAGSCDTTWIVTHGAGNNIFYAFALTSTGVSNTPVTSTLGPTLVANSEQSRGTIAFSPHGDRMAFGSGWGLYLFDFDIKTGKVSNSQGIATTLPYYGTEFSPDGQKLYYTQFSNGDLFQYDICTQAITLVDGSANYYGELVTAPNGKIYCPYNGFNGFSSPWLAEIGNPNGNSTNWNFTANKYNSGAGIGPGLPQMYFSPAFINKGNVQVDVTKTFADTICTNTSLPCMSLTATPSVAGRRRSVPAGYVDSHGTFDPTFNSGQDTTVVKVYFGMPGSCVQEDSVTVVVAKCCQPIGTNAPSAPICPGDLLNLNTLITDGTGTWTIGTTPPPAPGKANATIVGSNFTTKLNTNPGNYKVVFTMSNQLPGCQDTTNEIVNVKTSPTNAPDKTFEFCAGDSVLISAAVGPYDYSWSPGGGINATKMVKSAGNYYLTTTGSNSCISIDTIVVTQKSLPNVTPIDTSVCAGGAVNISAPASNNNYYLWDDATTGANDNISTTGNHWVIIEGNNGCRDTVFVEVNPGSPLNVSLNNPASTCA